MSLMIELRLLLKTPIAPSNIHSFPTRRSSDLLRRHAGGARHGQGALPGSGSGGGSRRKPIRREGRARADRRRLRDRKSTRLNSSHRTISYAVFSLKKKKKFQRLCAKCLLKLKR